MNFNVIRFLKTRKIYIYVFLGAVLIISLHGFYRSLSTISYQVPESILAQFDEKMHYTHPGVIHIMQMLMGPRAPRFQTTFLKSLFTTHFKEPNATPIHLHLLTDKATQIILDGIIRSWRIDKLNTTFYAAEPIQSKITWMLSLHSATNVATMKMYLPEILNSTVPKVLLLDTDAILLEDISNLWNHFENFDKYQFLGMALEQAPMYFNFKKIRGPRVDHGYNAGIMLWDLQKLTQKKWDAIWKPTFDRASRISPYFGSAEQTLLNAVIIDNPVIFYAIPCTWNVQMFELGTPEVCKSTWNNPPGKDIPQPQLLHADRWNKREKEFKFSDSLREDADITSRYIVIRSQYHMKDGYEFRENSPSMGAFDIQEVMTKLHPYSKVLTPNSLCRTTFSEFKSWCGKTDEFKFVIEHRIHPLYISEEYKKITTDENGITLALGVDFAQFYKLEEIAKGWVGPISVAIKATDLEAHKLLSKVHNSRVLRGRTNIYYHIVFQNPDFPPTIALHNTAVTYSPTHHVLILSSLNEQIRRISEFAEQIVKINPSDSALPIIQKQESSASFSLSTEYDFYTPSQNIISTMLIINRNRLKGLLIPTRYALLPNVFNAETDRRIHLLALLANSSM